MLIEHFIKRLPAYNNLFNGKGDINIPPYRILEPYRGYTWNDMLQIFIMLNSEITSHMHEDGGITFCYEPSAHGTIEIDASNMTILESNGEYKLTATYETRDSEPTVTLYDKECNILYRRKITKHNSYEIWYFPASDDSRVPRRIEAIYGPGPDDTPICVSITCQEHIRGFTGLVSQRNGRLENSTIEYFIKDPEGHRILDVNSRTNVFQWYDRDGICRKTMRAGINTWFDCHGEPIVPGRFERITHACALGIAEAEKALRHNNSDMFGGWHWYYADTMWNSINKMPPVKQEVPATEQDTREPEQDSST